MRTELQDERDPTVEAMSRYQARMGTDSAHPVHDKVFAYSVQVEGRGGVFGEGRTARAVGRALGMVKIDINPSANRLVRYSS